MACPLSCSSTFHVLLCRANNFQLQQRSMLVDQVMHFLVRAFVVDWCFTKVKDLPKAHRQRQPIDLSLPKRDQCTRKHKTPLAINLASSRYVSKNNTFRGFGGQICHAVLGERKISFMMAFPHRRCATLMPS